MADLPLVASARYAPPQYSGSEKPLSAGSAPPIISMCSDHPERRSSSVRAFAKNADLLATQLSELPSRTRGQLSSLTRRLLLPVRYAAERLLVPQPVLDPLCRVTLLFRNLQVVLEDLTYDILAKA